MNESYQEILENCPDPNYRLCYEIFYEYGLEFTMSDAFIFRRVLEECRDQLTRIQDAPENGWQVSSEASVRFLLEAYGINLHDYMAGFKSYEESQRRMRDLAIYIRDRLRPTLEML